MRALSIPDTIRPRVAQLVRLLGSDQDGEVVAAARAISRTLDGAGIDLSVLAAAIADPPEPIVIRQARTAPSATRRATPSRQGQAERLTRAAADPHSPLTRWERDFIASVVPALRGDGPLTTKQVTMVNRVLSKTRRRRS